jgi:hypothetical protein
VKIKWGWELVWVTVFVLLLDIPLFVWGDAPLWAVLFVAASCYAGLGTAAMIERSIEREWNDHQ